MKIYIQESFNFEDFEKQSNAKEVIQGYKRDKIAFILHQLNYIPMMDSRYQKTGQLIPLYSKILRERLGNNYLQYLDALGLAGIIETDNWYIPNERSKGYRLSFPFNSGELKEYEITDYSFKRNLEGFYEKQFGKALSKYPYLKKWFNSGLEINSEACYNFIGEDCSIKKNHPYLRSKERFKYKDSHIQYKCAKMCIQHLESKKFRGLTIDESGYRFHTLITSMRKGLRNGLTYEGKQLCELDIKNSQPFFSTQLFKPEFWLKEAKKKRFKPLIILIYKYNSINNSTIMFSKVQQMQSQPDVQRYIRLVQEGNLYEYFIEHYQKEFNVIHDRDYIKTELFSVLFSKNTTENRSKDLFAKLFPTVDKLFRMIKQGKHNTLSLLLQRIESDIIQGDICKDISEKYPHVPLLTIHDSIATTVENSDLIELTMQERFNARIGIVPKIKKEVWSLENMDKELNELRAKIRPSDVLNDDLAA